jgi:hypothetical protein
MSAIDQVCELQERIQAVLDASNATWEQENTQGDMETHSWREELEGSPLLKAIDALKP